MPKNMKTREIFCASQASTAICLSMDLPSSSSSIQLGGRAIDRHNPIIRDQRRASRALNIAPCTSQPPTINPQPYKLPQKNKKTKSGAQKQKKVATKTNDDCDKDVLKSRWSKTKAPEFVSPPGSSRYLLSDKSLFDGDDPVLSIVPVGDDSNNNNNRISCSVNASNPSSSSVSDKPPNQVVVLRVSLHCKGCEGKVRKHLAKMEGVRSFTIDFAAKKVTIVGDVTPLSVLASVSRVKNAQFWPINSSTEVKK